MSETRVYRFGCRAPKEERLALQALGQAAHYREDIRRAHNAQKRAMRALLSGADDTAHVAAYEREGKWQRVNDDRNAAIRSARERRGHLVDCGTYWLIEAALLQASKASGLDPIRPAAAEAEGRLGAAIQSRDQFSATLPWSHSRVQLTEPDSRGHALLTLRVGEAKKNSPTRTIAWPIKIHRPFPEGAVVRQVAVQRVRSGHRYRWEALVTVEYEACTARDAAAVGVVGVDIGWRREGVSGQRVATQDGAHGSCALHTTTHAVFRYADEVRGTRDRLFDQAKAYVKERQLPGWEHAHLWRDKDRMRRLARKVTDLGVAWYIERDKHLEDIECAARLRAERKRLDDYRVYADRLAKTYRVVALEDMPMAVWVGVADTHAAESRRSAAGLSFLQSAIIQRFGPDRIDWVPPENTTRTCGECGVIRTTPVGPAAEWACACCGVVHHQDDNAAQIIRTRCEQWIAAGNPVRARSRKAPKRHGKKHADAVATVEDGRALLTPRESFAEAAE